MAFKLADDTWVDTTVTLDKLAGTLTIEGGLPPKPPVADGVYTIDASVVKVADGTAYKMLVAGEKLIKYENNQATLYLKVTGSTKPEANYVGMFFGSNGQQTMDETIVGTKFADASYELALPLTDEMFGASTNVVLLNKDL